MFCMKCNKPFPSKCTCADRDARFQYLQGPAGSRVVLTFCSGCGEHYTMCQCPEPKPPREVRSEGRIVAAPRL